MGFTPVLRRPIGGCVGGDLRGSPAARPAQSATYCLETSGYGGRLLGIVDAPYRSSCGSHRVSFLFHVSSCPFTAQSRPGAKRLLMSVSPQSHLQLISVVANAVSCGCRCSGRSDTRWPRWRLRDQPRNSERSQEMEETRKVSIAPQHRVPLSQGGVDCGRPADDSQGERRRVDAAEAQRQSLRDDAQGATARVRAQRPAELLAVHSGHLNEH